MDMGINLEKYRHSIEEALVLRENESFDDFVERRYVDVMCFILFKELNEKAETDT